MPYKRPSQKSLDNLKKGTSFKKGQSGNPKGRPPTLPDLNILVAKVLSETKGDITAAEAILKKLVHRAMTETSANGVRAAEILLERGYGKVKQDIGVDAQVTNITRTILTKTIEHKA